MINLYFAYNSFQVFYIPTILLFIALLQTKRRFVFNVNQNFLAYASKGQYLHTLSKENVLVTAKLQPCSKARLIMAVLVAGGADANPNGFSNFIPHISTDMSTSSMSV